MNKITKILNTTVTLNYAICKFFTGVLVGFLLSMIFFVNPANAEQANADKVECFYKKVEIICPWRDGSRWKEIKTEKEKINPNQKVLDALIEAGKVK